MPVFSKAYRLVSKHDFQSVFAESNKISRHFLLALHRSTSLPCPRLGMIISKRYVKTAVSRNRLKRLIRESFRHHAHLLQGLDIIVLMRKKWTNDMQQKLQGEIEALWQALITTKSLPARQAASKEA